MAKIFTRCFMVVIVCLIPLVFTSCPEEDDDDACVQIVQGDYEFSVIETWDCDNIPENEPEVHGLIVSQLDCGISFTGTFRKGLSGIMNGTIVGSAITIDFYDNDVDCTLSIVATVSEDKQHVSGTWSDNCYDTEENCYGESGTFTAFKE